MVEQENRAHPRFDLLAQVQITSASEVYVMSTRNISRGGVFIQGVPSDYPELKVGVQVELVIFNPDDPGKDEVSLNAMVVRLDPGRPPSNRSGFGLQFLNMGQAGAESLERLLRVL